MKVLLGEEAEDYLKVLKKNNWINVLENIKGGIFESEISNIYVAYDCTGGETFVEDFNDIVEAAKYADGREARTINNEYL